MCQTAQVWQFRTNFEIRHLHLLLFQVERCATFQFNVFAAL